MQKVCATFRITTPMFLGGADNKTTAELRPASIKGILRFWYRAVNYGLHQNYNEIKRMEDKIFGSTAAQSAVFLKVDAQNIKIETEQSQCKRLFESGISYLGYGLDYEKDSEKKDAKKEGPRGKTPRKKGAGGKNIYRFYVIPEQKFSINLFVKPKYRKEINLGALIEPIKALGLFGGLGSRNRRGFGSVTLESISVNEQNYWIAPTSRNELKEAYKEFYSNLRLTEDIPQYTAFSKANRTVILKGFNNYKGALKEAGKGMMEFRRGYGRDARIVSDYLKGCNIDKHPERVVFGLPHNYFPGDKSVDINPIIRKERTRRASPLFIKIISMETIDGKKYVPVMTMFPSDFLPKGTMISLKSKGLKSVEIEHEVYFKLINDFMDDFSSALEVKP